MQIFYKIRPRLLSLFLFFFAICYAQAQQVVIYDADFSGNETSGGASGEVGGGWSASGTDGCNDDGIFRANGTSFEINDYEGSGCVDGFQGGSANNTWTTGPVNIRNYINVSVLVEVSGTDTGNGFDNVPSDCSGFNDRRCYDEFRVRVSGAASDSENFGRRINGRRNFQFIYDEVAGVCGDNITITITAGNQSQAETFFIDRVTIFGERGNRPTTLRSEIDVCEGDNALLQIANASGPSEVIWLDPDGDEIAACRNALVCPIRQARTEDQGPYLAQILDPNSGCFEPLELEFELFVLPSLPQTPRLNISNEVACRGQNINLTATPVGNFEYVWVGPDGSEITACRNQRICRLNNVDASDQGAYLVQVADPDSGPCALGEAQNFLIVSDGPGRVSAEPNPFCAGQTATINVNVQNQGNFNYTWIRASDNQEFPANADGSLTIDDIEESDEGLYLLIVSNEDGTCASEVNDGDGVVVIVNEGLEKPEIQVAGNICEGLPSLRVDASPDQLVLWFDENNNEVAEGTNTYRPTSEGNYYAAIIDPVSLCASPDSDLFFAEEAEEIVATISATDTQVCPDQTTSLTASGGTQYLWSTGATTASISVTSGDYTVTVSNGNGCEAMASLAVTEFADFEVNIAGAAEVCAGENSTLTASGGASYRWSSGQTSPTIVVGAGEYSVTVTSANGCEKVGTYSVSEFADFEVNIVGATEVCAGENSTLTASGGASYRWSSGQTSPTIVVGAGEYSVTVTSANGCEKADTYSVSEFADFEVNIAGAAEVCVGENSTLTASGGASYRWSSGQTSPTIVVGAGEYSVTVTSANGCEKVDTYSVSEFADFEVDIVGAEEVCVGENSTLTASGGASYQWSSGQTSPTIVVGAGEYSVTVTSANGCEKVDTY
ncbi:MAG: hypothetical protein AAGI49_11610, partial [Bacteroidota bacterium]